MSELAKEKLYRKELIKVGGKGNSNIERIRSLENAGGGGGILSFNKEYYNMAGNSFYLSACGILGNKIIRVDGLNANGKYQNQISTIENIDDLDNISVSNLGSMPNYATQGCGFVYGGKLYVVGGQTANYVTNQNGCCVDFETNEIYNFECVMPELINGKAVVDGKTIFIVGGFTLNSGARTKIIILTMEYNDVLGFDIPVYLGESSTTSIAFDRCAVEKIGKYCYAFATVSNKIYKFELNLEFGPESEPLLNPTIVELDEKLPVELRNGESATIGGNIYLTGDTIYGQNYLYKFNATTEKIEILYSGKTEKNNKVDFYEVNYPSMVTVGNKLYIICGGKGNYQAYRYIQELIEG